MSEQTVQPDSPTIEERIENLFGEEKGSQNDIQEASDEQQEEQLTEQAEESIQASDEFDNVEYEGKQYQVPKEIKEALLRQSDYTRKTQEVADRAAAVMANERALQAQTQFNQSIQQEQEAINVLDMQITQYSQLDWSQLDTDQLVRYKHQLDQLKEQRNAYEYVVQQKQAQFSQQQAENHRQMLEYGEKYLQKAIPSWNNDVKKEVASYLRGIGYTDAQLSLATNPLDLIVAYEAMQYRKLKSGKKEAMEKANKAPPMVKPGSRPVQTKPNFKQQMRDAKTLREKEAVLAKKLAHL